MRVAFLTGSISRDAGGLYTSVRRLAQSLDAYPSMSVDVLGLADAHTTRDEAAWAPLRPYTFEVKGPAAFGYAPGLAGAARQIDADILHTQGIWMYPSVVSTRTAQHTGTPYLITPRGMLDAWAVQNSSLKKKVAGLLFENRHLHGADCLHALCESEAKSMRAYGLDNPICIIPNAIDLPEKSPDAPRPWADRIPPDRRVVLFLGRIHPKKGLHEAIEGWRLARDQHPEAANWALAVVGWDDGNHVANLERQIADAGLTDDIYLLGPMFGEQKAAAFHHADAFLLPSFSEGLPMAVLEAWSYHLPVVMTPACNIPEGFDADAALHIEPTPESVAEGLGRLFALPDAERAAIGRRGRQLVEERFTWPRVAEQMHAVYDWLLGRGPLPAFVYTN